MDALRTLAAGVASIAAPPSPVVLTPAQATAVLDALDDPPLRCLAIVAMHTGLHQGELLGLRWEDVDVEQHKVHVRHALQRSCRRLSARRD